VEQAEPEMTSCRVELFGIEDDVVVGHLERACPRPSECLRDGDFELAAGARPVEVARPGVGDDGEGIGVVDEVRGVCASRFSCGGDGAMVPVPGPTNTTTVVEARCIV
jgi:hypothetical protein